MEQHEKKVSAVVHAEASREPLITIAMPIYNAGSYLRLAVLSILAQTEHRWEMQIIDDGSTDNALETIRDIADARILIYRDGHNRGLAARLNEVIDRAQGRYFARMDQDDVSYPERLARQLDALQANPSLDLVSVRAVLIDEQNEFAGNFPAALAHADICRRPWQGFHFPHPIWMGRIDWFRKHRYATPGPYLCEDQELLLRSYRDSRFATVDSIQFAYRIRTQPDMRKLAKTYRSVWRVQMKIFSQQGQYGYLVLATFARYMRLIRLAVLKMTGNTQYGIQKKKQDAAEERAWNAVLVSLTASEKKSS